MEGVIGLLLVQSALREYEMQQHRNPIAKRADTSHTLEYMEMDRGSCNLVSKSSKLLHKFGLTMPNQFFRLACVSVGVAVTKPQPQQEEAFNACV